MKKLSHTRVIFGDYSPVQINRRHNVWQIYLWHALILRIRPMVHSRDWLSADFLLLNLKFSLLLEQSAIIARLTVGYTLGCETIQLVSNSSDIYPDINTYQFGC